MLLPNQLAPVRGYQPILQGFGYHAPVPTIGPQDVAPPAQDP